MFKDRKATKGSRIKGLYVWGHGDSGQLGNYLFSLCTSHGFAYVLLGLGKNVRERISPVTLNGFESIDQFDAYGFHSILLKCM